MPEPPSKGEGRGQYSSGSIKVVSDSISVLVDHPLDVDSQAVLAILDGLARVNDIGLRDADIGRQDALAVH